MTPPKSELQQAYDRHYAQANHFGYREWVYRPFVRALARRAGLRPGARILDAGCGQGLFTALFASLGFEAVGVDLSEEGIRTARETYSVPTYIAADVRELASLGTFDCVFTRSCSLYNTDLFANVTETSDLLMSYLKPDGVFIFDYYSRLRATDRSSSWRYHSLDAVRRHFAHRRSAEIYYSLRLETTLLGQYALSRPVTAIASAVGRHSSLGGELIAIVRNEAGSGEARQQPTSEIRA